MGEYRFQSSTNEYTAKSLVRNPCEPFFFPGDTIAVLLLHGFSNTSHDVFELGSYLSERGIAAQGILLPGHGTSPSDLNETTWRDWYDAVEHARQGLQKQGYSAVFVVGLSLGGLLALHVGAHSRIAGAMALAASISMNAKWRLLARTFQNLVPEIRKGRIPLVKKAIPVVKDPQAAAGHVSYRKHALRAIVSLGRFQDHLCTPRMTHLCQHLMPISFENDSAVPACQLYG